MSTVCKPISVLLTAAGCPGASTCIRYLQGIRERRVRVVGVDSNPNAVGRYIADEFHVVPMATEPDYVDALLDVVRREAIDVVVVSSSYEVEVVSQARDRFEAIGVPALVSSPESLSVANNKQSLYETFRDHEKVRVPPYHAVESLEGFLEACEALGHPKVPLCFKPPFSKGSRGFRYLARGVSRRDLLLHHKPDNKLISLEEMVSIFQDEPDFPSLLVMEAVEGEEVDTMVLSLDGDVLLTTHKTRERERGGVIVQGRHCHRPDLDEAVCAMYREIPLSYNTGVQFRGGYLIEINPRLSTFLYTQDWVEPYFAIKLALGEWTPEAVRRQQEQVPMDLFFVRYFDQVFERGGYP